MSPSTARQFLFATLGICLCAIGAHAQSGPSAEFAAIARAVPPGEWRLIPSPASEALYKQNEIGATTFGVMGPVAVVTAWNGAAYDPARRELHLHGGGHADYGGNEMLTFSFDTLRWRRTIETYDLPSRSSANPCPQPMRDQDGRPSGHTYDGLVWSTALDGVLYFQTHGFCLGAEHTAVSGFRKSIWLGDPRAGQWRRLGPLNANDLYVATTELPDGRVVMFGNNSPARIYDPRTNAYVRTGEPVNWEFPHAIYAADRNEVFVLDWSRIQRLDLKTLRPTKILDFAGMAARPSYNDGFAYHPPTRQLVLWGGGRRITLVDPDTKDVRVAEAGGRAPSGDKPWSKFVYLPEFDVFAGVVSPNDGVWLYRLPATIQSVPKPGPSFADIVARARGSEIVVPPGRYFGGLVLQRSDVVIKAAGAHLTDIVEGKAALVIRGDNVTIEGLEISLHGPFSENEACIRHEGRNLVLRRIRCHDTQMGYLGGGPAGNGAVIIEDSLFERTGLGGRANLGHAIYAFSGGRVGPADSLTVRGTTIRSFGVVRPGHGIKSRAPRNFIVGNTIAGLDAHSARSIDLSNGGENLIEGNVLQTGRNADNSDMIGIALERNDPTGYHPGRTVIRANLFLSDHPGTAYAVNGRVDARDGITVSGNTLVGKFQRDRELERKWPVAWGENREFPDRAAAGLPQYPGLPQSAQAE